jgi:hypothetical protein
MLNTEVRKYIHSSVGTATGYRVDDRRFRNRIPGGTIFLFFHVIQTGTGFHQTLPNGYWLIFSRELSCLLLKLTNHFQLVPR